VRGKRNLEVIKWLYRPWGQRGENGEADYEFGRSRLRLVIKGRKGGSRWEARRKGIAANSNTCSLSETIRFKGCTKAGWFHFN